MESAGIPHLEAQRAAALSTPSDQDAPSVTAAVLAASSTIPAAAQEYPAGLIAGIRRLPAAIAHTIVPTPVRQTWFTLFNTFHIKYKTYPAPCRYSIPAFIVLLVPAELQQPGFFPRPAGLTNAIIGFLCAGASIFGVVALLEWSETNKWPWQEDGWVWPWQKWLWQATVYDLDASVGTSVDGITSPVAPRSPFAATPHPGHSSPPILTPETAMAPPPATISKQPFIIPPTPLLPRGLRPIHLPPPSPPQLHHSGLLGASPMAPRFKHFSGESFRLKHNDLKAMNEWMKHGDRSLAAIREGIEEERDAEGRSGYYEDDYGNGSELGGMQREALEFDVDEDGSEFGAVYDDGVGREAEGIEQEGLIDVKERTRSLIDVEDRKP